MRADVEAQTKALRAKGIPEHYIHYLGKEQQNYYKQLADTADIENIPDVIAEIHLDALDEGVKNPKAFRDFRYTIDGNKFTKVIDVYLPAAGKR